MKICVVCSDELGFSNTPTFGSGKLNDGNIVCTKCFKKINLINPAVAFKLKNYSFEDINNLFEESENASREKNSQLSNDKKIKW